MCLYVKKDEKTKIATEDIVVYKILEKKRKKFIFTKYRTPFQKSDIRWGKILTTNNPHVLRRNICDSHNLLYSQYIDFGFHSFLDIESARNVFYRFTESNNFIITKCIIPKNSKYVVGLWDVDINSVVSDKIKYIKKIKI